MRKQTLTDYDLTPLFNMPPREGVIASAIIDTRMSEVVYKRKIEKGETPENFTYPVKIRVTYRRKQIYFPCLSVTLDDYSKLHGAVKSKDLIKTKKLIQATFDRVSDTIEDLMTSEGFTMDGLAVRLKRGSTDSIFDAFDNKIEELQKAGKIGTSVWYSCAKNSFMTFLKPKTDIVFSDVTPSWLAKYEAQMLKEGKEFTTISINMRALRAILNNALRDGIITQVQYPFAIKNNGKYQIPEGKGRKIALSVEQLMKVFNHEILPENEKWRDLWIFSFYCQGANISDILRFKYQNREGDYLIWYRQKTISTNREKNKIKAFITPEMEDIIKRWGNPDTQPTNYIFPFLKPGLSPVEERVVIQNVTHIINKKMRAIGHALKVGDITTYWARHSWASISRREGVPIYSISKSLGHKSLSTTQIYLDSLSDDEITANAAKLPRRQK